MSESLFNTSLPTSPALPPIDTLTLNPALNKPTSPFSTRPDTTSKQPVLVTTNTSFFPKNVVDKDNLLNSNLVLNTNDLTDTNVLLSKRVQPSQSRTLPTASSNLNSSTPPPIALILNHRLPIYPFHFYLSSSTNIAINTTNSEGSFRHDRMSDLDLFDIDLTWSPLSQRLLPSENFTATFQFQWKNQSYLIETLSCSYPTSLQDHIAALIHQYQIPMSYFPLLLKQGQTAIHHFQEQLGNPSSFLSLNQQENQEKNETNANLLLNKKAWISMYNSMSSSFKSSSTSSDFSATQFHTSSKDASMISFSRAFTKLIHASIPGLVEALVQSQLQFTQHLQSFQLKQQRELTRLQQQHQTEAKMYPGLVSNHFQEYDQTLLQLEFKKQQTMLFLKEKFITLILDLHDQLDQVQKSNQFSSLFQRIDKVCSSLTSDSHLLSTNSLGSISLPSFQPFNQIPRSTSSISLPPSIPSDTLTPQISQLIEMGFPQEEAHAALFLSKNNVEQALSLLLEKSDQIQFHLKSTNASKTSKEFKSKVNPSLPRRLRTTSTESPLLSPVESNSKWSLPRSMQGKLSQWFSSASSSPKPSTTPMTPSADPLSETFETILGTQRKQTFHLTLIANANPFLYLNIPSHLPSEMQLALRSQALFQLFHQLRIFVIPSNFSSLPFPSEVSMIDWLFQDPDSTTFHCTRHSQLTCNIIAHHVTRSDLRLLLESIPSYHPLECIIPIQAETMEATFKLIRASLVYRTRKTSMNLNRDGVSTHLQFLCVPHEWETVKQSLTQIFRTT